MFESKLQWFFFALNVGLTALLIIAGVHCYHLRGRHAQVQVAMNEQFKLVNIANLLSTNAGFLLGAANGTIPSFLAHVIFSAQDMHTTTANIENAAANFTNAAQAYVPDSSFCFHPFTCPGSGMYVCPNQPSTTVNCPSAGAVANCALISSCGLAVEAINGAQLVSSVARKLKEIPGVKEADFDGIPAAFSKGLFSVADVVEWIGIQPNVNEWGETGRVCAKFMQNILKNKDWTIGYHNPDGSRNSFTLPTSVLHAFAVIGEYCDIVGKGM